MRGIEKFVEWNVPAMDALRETTAFKIREQLDNGKRLDREQKNWLTHAVNTNAYFRKAVPVMGYRVPFDDVLRRFAIKQYGGSLHEMWATDKTAIRNMVVGSIDEIVELPQN